MIKKLLNSKFKKDLIFSYFTQGVTIGFGFLQLFLINRYFGVETYGQLAIIMSTAGIFSALLTARSSEAITRFFTREMINNNFQNAKFILTIGFCIDIITALFMIGLTYMLSEFVAETFMKNIKFSSEVFLYSFVIFFGFLRGTIFGYFQSKEMFFLINTITIFESFIKIVALILIVFVFSNSTLEDVIWTLIIASFLSFLYALIVFLKYYIQEFWTTHLFFNKVILKEYWSFNIKTFASSSLKAGNDQIDVLVLSYFTSPYLIGIYSIFKKILGIFSIVISQISVVTFTKIIKLYETKDFVGLIHNIKRKTYLIFSLITPMFILVLVGLNMIFAYMNITFSNLYYIVFVILFLKIIASALMWWWRAFIITHNPMIPIYINILNLTNTILIPMLLFNFFKTIEPLLLISLSNFLIILPMGLIGYYYFYISIYKKVKND